MSKVKLQSFDENCIREDLERCGIARFYYQAVQKMILRMFDSGTLPKTPPKIEQGKQKRIGDKKWNDFWNYYFFKQMLDDRRLIDAYLLEEEIVPKYSSYSEKGKVYITVKFYPESRVKHIVVFQDYNLEKE